MIAEVVADLQDEVLEVGAGLRVDRGERLVHEQQLGLVGQRAGDGDALLHAAGELPRVAVADVGQPDRRERLLDPRLALAPSPTPSTFSGSATLPATVSHGNSERL